jgi:hypothetical protein
MKRFIVFICLFLTYTTLACSVVDLTDQSRASERSALFDNMNNPGVRLAWSGMKEMNKQFGLGGVNAVIANHERTICNRLASTAGVNVEILKTDFKGYYINCTPTPGCVDIVNRQISSITPPKFPNSEISFNTISTTASNYQEGYVQTRVIAEYPDFRPPLHEFIEREMNEATRLAKAAHPDISEAAFRELLSTNADIYRTDGIASVDQAFQRLVKGLDNLLETPFAGANNIENELLNAMRSTSSFTRNGYQVSSAITGDDLFIIVKKDGEIVKVIGSDARGLGVTNMMTRYIEYGAQASTNGIRSMNDVFDLSMRAINRADSNMDTSLNRYFSLVEEELQKGQWSNVDEMIEAAHHRYHSMIEDGADMMVIRSGSIELCGSGQGCLMNKVTALHNRLKVLERLGVDLSYGASCLSIEYTLFLNGLK